MNPSTGLPNLDNVLHGIRPGDNVVWQVDSIDDYLPFARRFADKARAQGETLVYFRFCRHTELVPQDSGARVYHLRPEAGFESFISGIHEAIRQTGPGANFIFDSLSELALDYYSERMIGNFFVLTCPFLYELNSLAYFVVLRNYHSYHAAQPIADTTQILLNVYRHEGRLYAHPLKVKQRFSPTMHMLHLWQEDDFVPITESASIAGILSSAPWPGLQSASYRMVGMWDRRFMRAEELLESHRRGEIPKETAERSFGHLLTQLFSRDERVLALAEKYLTLADVIHVWKRVIGSGMVGGKSVGMLLARAILRKADGRWADVLEAHDSFFIGSDIFYSFLVQNGCWKFRQKQKNPATLLDGAEEARHLIMNGTFPDFIVRRFSDMLEYFGQSPIIVRSSSLLEDSFGNAFAGKYESVFCANQGTHQQRLDDFINAVRRIYASAMSEKALTYRAKRNVLDQDEQMALLVQRVSGTLHGKLFYPHLAGVGLSFNPYVWDSAIDPEAGVLRLVFGLGTRAVDRSDDDYTRVVALNAPEKRPEAGMDQTRRYAQRRVDVLDLAEDRFSSSYFADVVKRSPGLPVSLFASYDEDLARYAQERRMPDIYPWTLTFENALSKTAFVADVRAMLATLREAFGCHVDIEFTANFSNGGAYKINLVQCRPLPIREQETAKGPVSEIGGEDLILKVRGAVIGQSRDVVLDRLIFVVPSVYGALPERDRFAVARLVGQLTHLDKDGAERNIMLVGPGRWATSTPSLGVPVSFAEISKASVVCEIDTMREGLVPDLSLGTHFFNELVETGMLYIGVFRSKRETVFNEGILLQAPNLLRERVPEEAAWSNAVRVIETVNGRRIHLSADHTKQTAIVYAGQ